MPREAERPRDFPARVRAGRGYAGLTQAGFGKLIGVHGTTIRNWEKQAHTPDEMAYTELAQRLSAASKLPEWFFTVPRLASARLPAPQLDAGLDQRLSEIESALKKLDYELGVRDLEARAQIAEVAQAIRRFLPPPQP